jgi:hypothetical protein
LPSASGRVKSGALSPGARRVASVMSPTLLAAAWAVRGHLLTGHPRTAKVRLT